MWFLKEEPLLLEVNLHERLKSLLLDQRLKSLLLDHYNSSRSRICHSTINDRPVKECSLFGLFACCYPSQCMVPFVRQWSRKYGENQVSSIFCLFCNENFLSYRICHPYQGHYYQHGE